MKRRIGQFIFMNSNITQKTFLECLNGTKGNILNVTIEYFAHLLSFEQTYKLEIERPCNKASISPISLLFLRTKKSIRHHSNHFLRKSYVRYIKSTALSFSRNEIFRYLESTAFYFTQFRHVKTDN